MKKKKLLSFTLVLALMVALLLPAGTPVYAAIAPDYTITNNGVSFDVNGSGPYADLNTALVTCTTDLDSDGKLLIQFGNGSALSVPVIANSSSYDLPSAYYTGSINLTGIHDGYNYGLKIPGSSTVTFQGLTVTNDTTDRLFFSIIVETGGTLNVESGTLLEPTFSTFNTSSVVGNSGTLNIAGGTIGGDPNNAIAINNAGGGVINATGGIIQSSNDYGTGVSNYGSIAVSGTARITAPLYGIDAEGGASGSVTINGGIVESTGSIVAGDSMAIMTRGSDVTVTGGIVRTMANFGRAIYYTQYGSFAGGRITISGGTVSSAGTGYYDAAIALGQDGTTTISGTANVIGAKNAIYFDSADEANNVTISGGTVESTDATPANNPASGAAINMAVDSASTVTINGGTIKSTNQNTLRIIKDSTADDGIFTVFGTNVYSHDEADIRITGVLNGGKYEITAADSGSATVTASNISAGKVFYNWAKDSARANVISTVNGDSLSNLSAGANTNVYLKTGAISPLASFTPVTLVQTGDVAHHNVQYATANAVIAALPTTVAVTLVNSSVVNVPVTWTDTDSYNAGAAAAYTFTATWGAMPAGANNNNSLAAPTVEVTVAAGVIPTQPSTPSTPSAPTSSGVDIIVNKDKVNAGTAANSTEGEKTVTTITVDQQKLNQKLAAEGNNALVIVPISSDSDKLIAQLNGQMIKDMEEKQATLEVRTGSATYTLPVSEINIGAVSSQLGTIVTLSNITVQVSIASPSDQTVTVVKSAAKDGGFSLAVPAVDFNIRCTYNDKTVDVSDFNVYVERTVAIPDGVDPAKITTGIVVSPDGTVRHVPTKVTMIDGRYYAVINSLTNSTYTVIWHPVEFSDVAASWAKDAINDMGSRMVVAGVGNNKYAPDRYITRAEFAAIIVRALGLAPETGKSRFSDVEASKWYCGYVQTASSYDIIQGYNRTTFGPEDRITREQAMTMIARAMKITGLKSEVKDREVSSLFASYSDAAAASDYAKTSIAACLKTGIIKGRSSKTIAPKYYITRAEVAAAVQRLLQKSNLI